MVLLEIIDYNYRLESCDHWWAAHGLAGHMGLNLSQVFKSSAEWRHPDRGTLLLSKALWESVDFKPWTGGTV